MCWGALLFDACMLSLVDGLPLPTTPSTNAMCWKTEPQQIQRNQETIKQTSGTPMLLYPLVVE